MKPQTNEPKPKPTQADWTRLAGELAKAGPIMAKQYQKDFAKRIDGKPTRSSQRNGR